MALSFTTTTKEDKKYTLTIEGMAVELNESTAQEVINLITSKGYTFESVAKKNLSILKEQKNKAPIVGTPIFEGGYKMVTHDSSTDAYYCYIKTYKNNVRFAIKNDLKNNYGVVFDGNFNTGDFKYKFPNKDMAFKAISETIKYMSYSSEEERAKDLAKYEVKKTSNRGQKKQTVLRNRQA